MALDLRLQIGSLTASVPLLEVSTREIRLLQKAEALLLQVLKLLGPEPATLLTNFRGVLASEARDIVRVSALQFLAAGPGVLGSPAPSTKSSSSSVMLPTLPGRRVQHLAFAGAAVAAAVDASSRGGPLLLPAALGLSCRFTSEIRNSIRVSRDMSAGTTDGSSRLWFHSRRQCLCCPVDRIYRFIETTTCTRESKSANFS